MVLACVLMSVLLTERVLASVDDHTKEPYFSAQGLDYFELRSRFHDWLYRHGKTYSGSQFSRRLSIFSANAATVERHNEAHLAGLTSYAMTTDGPFADLNDEEFADMYLMEGQNCSATHTSSGPVPRKHPGNSLPSSVDWRSQGVITPIKSQGHCGSCWTFSTTGTLEAHSCITKKQDCTAWSGLAEQQLVDCAGDYNNHGCNGGLPSQAFEYIHYSGGISTEDTYKYTAKDGTCKRVKRKNIGAEVQAVHNITTYDESEIVVAVAEVGPVSVAYQVAPDFRLYSHGVYDAFNATSNQTVCKSDPQSVNHAVVAVGYGETMEDPPVPFHIIRNSWGNAWGMEGYFWILRGENLCGISDCASFPVVHTQSSQQQGVRGKLDFQVQS